jgi:hypothetical protein
MENAASFIVPLLDRVYRAVVWQHDDQVRYNIKTGMKE